MGVRARPLLMMLILGACGFAIFLAYLAFGSVDISLRDVISGIFGGGSDDANIVHTFRLPRALYAVLAGALLGLVGSAFQAFFRNPLADPYVVGVSSGAAVGGALAIVMGFGASWAGWAAGIGPLALATLFGLLTLGLVLALSVRRGVVEPQTLLLIGIVVGSMLAALLSLILLWSGTDQRVVLGWLMGSMTPAYWNRILLMAIVLAIGCPILILQGKRLNALALGDETATHLGVDTRRLKPLVLGVGAAMVAVAVGSIGIVGFLGLVAPHIARRLVGVDWRWSLGASGLVGAGLLCAADLLAQRVVPSAEVPVGVVTAILGAPFLVVLLRRS